MHFFVFFLFSRFFPPLVVFGGWAVLCVSRPLPFENPTCPGQKKYRPAKIVKPKKLGSAICIFNMKALGILHAMYQGPAHLFSSIYMLWAQGRRGWRGTKFIGLVLCSIWAHTYYLDQNAERHADTQFFHVAQSHCFAFRLFPY